MIADEINRLKPAFCVVCGDMVNAMPQASSAEDREKRNPHLCERNFEVRCKLCVGRVGEPAIVVIVGCLCSCLLGSARRLRGVVFLMVCKSLVEQ